ncbi:MAG: TPM domain-containing protein [Hydrogenophilaceae bacterium]
MFARIFRHLIFPDWWWRRKLPEAALHRIQSAVASAEKGHSAEIRIAVEATLELPALLRGELARERAVEVFSRLRVWDTEENNGVLLYVLLADHDVEIVADRGVAKRVAQSEWEVICREMEALFRTERQEEALLAGVRLIGERLSALYPDGGKPANQLPDRPAMLS